MSAAGKSVILSAEAAGAIGAGLDKAIAKLEKLAALLERSAGKRGAS